MKPSIYKDQKETELEYVDKCCEECGELLSMYDSSSSTCPACYDSAKENPEV